ncbi:unnamed protein product [Bathycoccus prasinos]
MMRRRRRDVPLCEGKISNRRCTTLTRVNQRRILARGCLKMTCAHTTSTPATAFVKQRPPTLSRERYNHRNALVSSALFCGLSSILHKIRAQKNTLKFIMPKDTSEEDALVTDPSKKTKKAFKKFSYRGVDLEQLLELKTDKLVELFCARQRRRFRRGLGRKPLALVKKLRKAKREVQGMDKPETIRTHLRNMIIVPEMIGAIVGVYNGKVFNTVEIKPEMVGTYLAEYAITYKPISHGRAGIGGEKFVPLK